MTDSTLQYQRATAEDYAWIEELARKCDAGEGHGDIGYRVVWSARYRRILNSLRAAPVVPDREALARALYIATQESFTEADAALLWDDRTAKLGPCRERWIGEADRLVRILGGFPAVPEQPASDVPREVLDYVANFAHIGLHGLKEARTWQGCDRHPCKVAARVDAPTPSPDAELERQMQEAWRKDLEDAVADAIHTLENEVHAGTKFNEPEWAEGTLAMLKRVAPPLPSDATQRQD